MEPAERHGCVINSLEAAAALFAPRFERAREERLYIAHLDQEQRLLGLQIRYADGGRPVPLSVRAIIADAMALRSEALILAHNHPSGDPTPSPTDIEATRRLVQAARPIGLAVRDHLVFGGGAYASFRARGLL